jgi:uncharacterized RDD family membrane protein YckC
MTNSNDVIKIDTPENVTFDYDIAGIGSRFLAALADTAIILLLQAIVLGTIVFIISRYDENSAAGVWVAALLGVLSFLLLWGYYVFFEFLWNGQSPGKRLVGLRVIRVDGTPISESESIIRNLVRLIDFLPFAYGVGVVTMFINSASRRVGDLTAGTVVVHDRKVENLQEPWQVRGGFSTVGSDIEIPEGFPIEKLTAQELQVIEELLHRWDDLSNRYALARHILTSIMKRLDISTATVPLDRSDRILIAIYKMHRARTLE